MDLRGRKTIRRAGSTIGLLGWLAVLASPVGPAVAAEEAGVTLTESVSPDAVTGTWIELKASGLYRPPLPPEAMTADAKMPKPLDVDIQTRVVYWERTRKGPQARAVRLVRQAASAINGEIRPFALELRPELALLIAERRDLDGAVTVASPAGSLTRGELELVEGLGDTLCLGDLLPEGPTSKGSSWPVRKSALWALTGYDAIVSTTLEAQLESVDDARARITLKGEVKGSVLGAEGTLTCDGWLTFDRKAGLIDGLELNRTESRQPGAVEAGLDLKSTLKVTRRATGVPPELADAALASLSMDLTPGRLLLQLIAPDGRYNLLHDRSWHTYWDDKKLVVLKRYEKGRVTAQCNLAYGPPAGKGKHQDVESFREDVKRALKERFGQFLGAGEVDGGPDGGFRYKLGVQGRYNELGLLWFYYLIASPAGDQLLATFTLVDSDAGAFGSEDETLVGSLQWNDPPLPVSR